MQVYADFEVGLSRESDRLFSVHVRIRRYDNVISTPAAGSFYYDDALRKSLRAKSISPDSYGQALGNALWQDDLLAEFDRVVTAAASLNRVVRLTIQIDRSAYELQALRWETIQHPRTGLPLANDGRILFSRFLNSASGRTVRLVPRGQTRAVVAIAAPGDAKTKWSLPPIDLVQELATAQAGLTGLSQTLIGGAHGPATREALLKALRQNADILYLVAHGGLLEPDSFPELGFPGPHPPKLPCLFLERSDGCTLPVAANDFAADLAQLPALPRLAIVVSCRSADPEIAASLAWLLGEVGVPAVLAMQGDFQMSTAKVFLPALLESLQRDEPIDAAVAAGRAVARSAGCLDWWMPALFSRVSDGQIWQADDHTYRHRFEYWVHHQQRQLSVEELRRLTNALIACPSTSQLPLADIPDLASLCEELYYRDARLHPMALGDLDAVLHELQLLPPIPWPRIVEIQQILAKVALTRSDLDHLYGYSRPGVGWEQPVGRDSADTLARIVRQLAGAFKDHRGSQALIEFVRRLRAELPERVASVRSRLDAWEAAACAQLGLAQISERPDDVSLAPALVIQIALAPGVVAPDLSKPESVSVIFDAWLITDTATQLAHREELSLGQAATRFTEVERAAIISARVGDDALRVEFVLPQELLLYAVETWTAKRTRIEPPTEVALLHPVVVRSLDRLHPDDIDALLPNWQSRWRRRGLIDLKVLSDPATWGEILVLIDTADRSIKAVHASLANAKRVMVLQTAHRRDEDTLAVLNGAISQGYPVALVLRKPCSDPAQMAAILCGALAAEPSLDKLPGVVMAQRQAAGESDDDQHYGNHLTLLWDDPEQLPPKTFYHDDAL